MDAMYKEIGFTDADIVNLNDFIPSGAYNPHNVRPFLLHDHGFTICVVFASNLQDALDIAADANKLDFLAVTVEEMADYENEEELSHLGNAGESFDIESLGVMELPNPKNSFVALFNATE